MDVPTEMQHQAMGYDRSATMFSPEGHLLQVEYAEKIVKLGSACIGLVCEDGVVIISDRRIRDKLVTPESMNKVYEIDEHIMATAAGILSDARMLVDQAQVLSQQHRVTYDSPIDPVEVIKLIADKKQMFTQYGGVRPFGASLLVGGTNKGKAHLFTSDVYGNYYSFRANAIGENDEKIKEILRKDFKDDMKIDDGIKFGLKIFKEILDKNFDLVRFDIGYIKTAENKLVRLHGDELKKFVR
ncbi:MAG: archaeal proteasome endopeptidase complex subunit alpha [Nanoarchaeota archaeon]